MGDSAGIFRSKYVGGTKGPAYDAWREGFARHWLSTDFESLGRDDIVNDVSATEHSVLALCNMRTTPVRIRRRDDAISRSAGIRYLVIASGPPVHVSQRGRHIDVSPGQVVLLSGDDPAQLIQATEGGRWSIRMTSKLVRDLCPNAEDQIALPIEASPDLVKLLLHQIETAHRFRPKLDATANQAIAQHLLDLIALCLGTNRDVAELATHRGLAAARLDAVKAAILRDLASPDVTLGRIAGTYRLSTRYIQHLFEAAGTSFTDFVLESRLSLAHRLLRDSLHRSRKVSDIAMSVGFSDISYFNRAFKARFGATPTDVRAYQRSGISDR